VEVPGFGPWSAAWWRRRWSGSTAGGCGRAGGTSWATAPSRATDWRGRPPRSRSIVAAVVVVVVVRRKRTARWWLNSQPRPCRCRGRRRRGRSSHRTPWAPGLPTTEKSPCGPLGPLHDMCNFDSPLVEMIRSKKNAYYYLKTDFSKSLEKDRSSRRSKNLSA
jgi:hypothetical protein